MSEDTQAPTVDLVGEIKQKAHSPSDVEADAVRAELGHIFEIGLQYLWNPFL